jgi:hypothetical protein
MVTPSMVTPFLGAIFPPMLGAASNQRVGYATLLRYVRFRFDGFLRYGVTLRF